MCGATESFVAGLTMDLNSLGRAWHVGLYQPPETACPFYLETHRQ